MDSDEFDQLLQQTGATATARPETLDRLVAASRDGRRRSTKPAVIGLTVAGVVRKSVLSPPVQALEAGPVSTWPWQVQSPHG